MTEFAYFVGFYVGTLFTLEPLLYKSLFNAAVFHAGVVTLELLYRRSSFTHFHIITFFLFHSGTFLHFFFFTQELYFFFFYSGTLFIFLFTLELFYNVFLYFLYWSLYSHTGKVSYRSFFVVVFPHLRFIKRVKFCMTFWAAA